MWKRIYHDHYEVNRSGTVRRVKAAQGTRPGRVLQPYGPSDVRKKQYVDLSAGNQQQQYVIADLIGKAFGAT